MIPVIFTHRGPQDYVRIAIEQARRWGNHVALLGNEENAHLDVEHYLNKDYWQGADDFSYTHMSGNHQEMELYCLQIYFVARNLAREKGWGKLFLIDSDVMLYCNVEDEEPTDYDLAINWCKRQEPYRWSACLHNSYWKLETLEAMCDFIMEAYSGGLLNDMLLEKWGWHQDNGVPGGVCDMTLLHFFRQGRKAVNLSRVRDGKVWDDNINQAENYWEDEYGMDNAKGIKRLAFLPHNNDARPAGIRSYKHGDPENPGQATRFNALHFQGQAKGLMEEYAT